jgi:hypothetical protein
MKITEHNALTGQTVERDATAEEIAQFELNEAMEAERVTAEALKAEAKAGLLDRLGITAEEAKLLSA